MNTIDSTALMIAKPLYFTKPMAPKRFWGTTGAVGAFRRPSATGTDLIPQGTRGSRLARAKQSPCFPPPEGRDCQRGPAKAVLRHPPGIQRARRKTLQSVSHLA